MSTVWTAVVSTTWEFFRVKSTSDICLFVVSVLAFVEFFVFGLLISITFLNVSSKPDLTTSFMRLFISMMTYISFRSLFLPFMISGILLNNQVDISWLAITGRVSMIIMAVWWTFITVVPGLVIWYSVIKYGIGDKPLKLQTDVFNFVIVLPVFNETLELLIDGVHSILYSNVDKNSIELHVAFDSDERSELYNAFLCHFGVENGTGASTISFSASVDGISGLSEVYIHKWKHSGKRLTQAKTFDFIRTIPRKEDNTIVLFTDSDNFLYPNALGNLACLFTKHPNKLAFAGYMTCMSSGWSCLNPLRLIQDAEYVGGEINRGVELMMGTVNCLPGGFTAIRYKSLLMLSDTYFSEFTDENITDFHRLYLGEDRYMSHLAHLRFPYGSIGFAPCARAKTDPPTTFMALIKQRRRWLLGAIANEVYMLSDSVIGSRYPVLCGFKLFQLAWKGTTLGQIVMSWLAVKFWTVTDIRSGILPFVYAVGIPFVFSWVASSVVAMRIGHFKIMIMFPFMHLVTAIVAFLTDIYTVFTWKKRTWGGARATPVAAVDTNFDGSVRFDSIRRVSQIEGGIRPYVIDLNRNDIYSDISSIKNHYS
jgi:cellulose synthase/poly-beta-1,6-N-acetylglucosamine synthase-like glycosyltransferase